MDISFIDNVIDGYAQLTKLLAEPGAEQLRGRVFAVSSGEAKTLKELVSVFEKATKTRLSINWGKKPYRPREVMLPWNRGEPIPGWQPKISVEEGIKKTFNES